MLKPIVLRLLAGRKRIRRLVRFSGEFATPSCYTCIVPLNRATARQAVRACINQGPIAPEVMKTISLLLLQQRRRAPALATRGQSNQPPPPPRRDAPALPLAALCASLLLVLYSLLLASLVSGSILLLLIVVVVFVLLVGLSRPTSRGFFFRLAGVLWPSQQHRARDEGLGAHREVLFGGVEPQDRAKGRQ